MKAVEKVVVYVTRASEVLVFRHRDFPEAGVQVPAGSVDPGEDLESAVIREVKEECGLILSGGIRFVGRFEWPREDRGEVHFRNVFQVCAPADAPDNWLHEVTGLGEDRALVFECYWMKIKEAQRTLAAGLGNFLDLLS